MFEATLLMSSIAIGDNVQQVFLAALTLIRTLLKKANIPVPKSCQNNAKPPPYFQTLFAALLHRAASSNERSANEAHRTLLIFVFETPVGALFLESMVLGHSDSKPGNWRPLLARLRLLVELIKKDGLSGTVDDVLALALPALENANAKVRQAAVGVLALALEPSSADIEEADLEQFIQSQLGSHIKSAVISAIAKQLLVCRLVNKQVASKHSSRSNKPPRHNAHAASLSRSRSNAVGGNADSGDPAIDFDDAGGAAGGGTGGKDKSGGGGADLPFADPLPKEVEEGHEAQAMIRVFGPNLVRCVFSSDWSNREAALRYTAVMIKTRAWQALALGPPSGDSSDSGAATSSVSDLIQSCLSQLSVALTDRVIHVYQAGIKMLNQLIKSMEHQHHDDDDDGIGSNGSGGDHLLLAEAMTSLFPLLIKGLGDSKPKKRKCTESILLRMCRYVRCAVLGRCH
jgi:hypothetical protein